MADPAENVFIHAVVTTVDLGNDLVYVAFEGDADSNDVAVETAANLPYLSRYIPAVNDRVLLASVKDTWVIIDRVGTMGVLGVIEDDLTYTPGGNEDSSSTTTVTTWENLGTIDVPSWATKTKYTLTYNGIWGTAGAAIHNVGLRIGSVDSAFLRFGAHDTGTATPTQQPLTMQDKITGLSPGNGQTVLLRAGQASGSGVLRAGVTSKCSVFFKWLP
jgi:hypothetical protein